MIRVPAGEGRAAEVRAGSLVEVLCPEGQQVCDFVAVRAGDPREYLSTTHTRSALGRIALRPGDRLISNLRQPMFELVEDTVGCHDLLFAACDRRRYEVDYGLPGHRNCRENLAEALGPYGVDYATVPDPFNWFMATRVLPDGTLQLEPSPARPGDRVVLRALVDAVVAASACPQDQNPINGWRVKDIVLVVREPA